MNKRILGTILQLAGLTGGVAAGFMIHPGLGVAVLSYFVWLVGEEVYRS